MKKIVLISLFVLLEMLSIFLAIKSFSNKNIAETKEIYEIDKKQFSMYIENEEGNYEEYIESNKFPEGYQINIEKSKCVDTKGNVINGILTGSGTNITITSSKTSYCYLYFDILKDFFSKKIIYLDTVSDIGLQQDFVAGDNLYRFSGTNGNTGINNYICLGADSCTSGDDNMYRIIGVNPDNGEVKVIKETSWNNELYYRWNNSNDSNVKWLTSTLYTSTVSVIYDDLSFKDMIVTDHSWNIGSVTSTSISSRAIVIDYENNTTGIATIGIMSLSDYYLAYNNDVSWYGSASNKNWLNINNSVENGAEAIEKTMTYYGKWQSSISAWGVYGTSGYVTRSYVIDSGFIRPTFYLKPEVMYVDGNGTSSDPFVVNYIN